jgi:hypothetical protein
MKRKILSVLALTTLFTVVMVGMGQAEANATPDQPATVAEQLNIDAVNRASALSGIPDAYDVCLFFKVHSGDAAQPDNPYSQICSFNENAVVYGCLYIHPASPNYLHYRLDYLWADGHWTGNVAVSQAAWESTCL